VVVRECVHYPIELILLPIQIYDTILDCTVNIENNLVDSGSISRV
jgi:hypothetical protein